MDDQNKGFSSATYDLSRLSQMMDCSFLMNGDTNGVIYRLGTSDSEVCCVVCALRMKSFQAWSLPRSRSCATNVLMWNRRCGRTQPATGW